MTDAATRAPRIVLLAGGAGGSAFAVGLRDVVRERAGELTVICNTADDWWLAGLRIQPDVDSMLYGLAGAKDTTKGWGRAGDSLRVAGELQAWGATPPWFELGDLDLGAHIARTSWLRAGATPSVVLERLQARWADEIGARLLPMTDAEVETHVVLDDTDNPENPENPETIHFQEWWTRYRAKREPRSFTNPGMATATPAPGVLEAIAGADVVLIAPSNPIVSIGPILAVPGVREAVASTPAPVVGVSPIIGGAPVRGMADVCLRVAGVECSAAGVAAHFGARSQATGVQGAGLLDAWLIAEEDASSQPAIEALGLAAPVRPLWMRGPELTRALASDALAAAGL